MWEPLSHAGGEEPSSPPSSSLPSSLLPCAEAEIDLQVGLELQHSDISQELEAQVISPGEPFKCFPVPQDDPKPEQVGYASH
tara:strand:+ start:1421 stop:1666 length:246 start_codon:yes stop_codon:yes gene_type:complete